MRPPHTDRRLAGSQTIAHSRAGNEFRSRLITVAPHMFLPDDAKYLIRRLGKNEVVLFLGAGFSSNATNLLGKPLPLSRQLAASIWDFLAYPDAFDDTSLPDIYEALLRSGKPDTEIRPLLENHLLTSEIPRIYDSLVRPFWYRVYTTNVDDLLQRLYRRNSAAPHLTVASFPQEELRERDQSLSSLQAIFLNGILPCSPRDLTFSVRQYARRSGTSSPLYQAFLGDYSYYPTVFIGTELNEPLFWQHLEARESRQPGISEQRPKSFLISPRISPPKRVQLDALNVVPIEATVGQFLAWLDSISDELPAREDVLRETLPSVVALFERAGASRKTQALEEFGRCFHLVPTTFPTTSDRSFFLLGATPRWEDIFRDLDAPRDITSSLFTTIDSLFADRPVLSVHALLGSAGCGKSTILRRLAVRLSQAGRLTFITNSEELPEPSVLAAALQQLPDRAVLLFDNAAIALGRVAEYVGACQHLPTPPLIIIASRLNDYDRRGAQLQRCIEVTEHEVPHLSRPEIIGIIQVLERNGLLGPLQGLSDAQRIDEFEAREKAGKQLLVAMREATSGRGFNVIIENEFASLPSPEVKLMYLFVALATDAGYRLNPTHIIAASTLQPAETLHALSRTLKGIVLPTGPREDQLVLRHQVIASHIVDVAAPRTLLADAYKALVPILAAAITGHSYRSSVFALFRELINHRVLFERFEANLAEARDIYEAVSWTLRSHAHFWLQYGLLELWYGHLEFAENYLRQAEALSPNSDYIQNSIGHLYLKQALAADSSTIAYHLRHEGSAILNRQMAGDRSPYPYHIYCSQRLAFARTWLSDHVEKQAELEHLRETMTEALRQYPRSKMFQRLQSDLELEYLRLALQ